MKSVLLKISFVASIAGLTAFVSFGQSHLPALDRTEFKGKVKLATLVREYSIMGGNAVAPTKVIVSQSEFGRDGKTVRHSHFGNVERRQIYTYPGGKQTIEVQYFDSSGQQVASDKVVFQPKADIPLITDLCTAYLTRGESDKQAGIDRSIETCISGSLRATTVTEKNPDSTYFRTVREDAKGRTYEVISIYNSERFPIERRYLVNNLESPKYTWNISFVDHKSDTAGNLTETLVSAIHSSQPHHVSYQYIEKYEIVYF